MKELLPALKEGLMQVDDVLACKQVESDTVLPGGMTFHTAFVDPTAFAKSEHSLKLAQPVSCVEGDPIGDAGVALRSGVEADGASPGSQQLVSCMAKPDECGGSGGCRGTPLRRTSQLTTRSSPGVFDMNLHLDQGAESDV